MQSLQGILEGLGETCLISSPGKMLGRFLESSLLQFYRTENAPRLHPLKSLNCSGSVYWITQRFPSLPFRSLRSLAQSFSLLEAV